MRKSWRCVLVLVFAVCLSLVALPYSEVLAQSANGANTGIPLFTPNKAIAFNQTFTTQFDQGYRQGAGNTITNIKYDFLATSSNEAAISAFYNSAMQTAGYTSQGRTALNQGALAGAAFTYTKGNDLRQVVLLGPITAAQVNDFNSALTSGTLAANDTVLILISGTANIPSSAPASGLGGSADNSSNNLWLIAGLAVLAGSALTTLGLRRKRIS